MREEFITGKTGYSNDPSENDFSKSRGKDGLFSSDKLVEKNPSRSHAHLPMTPRQARDRPGHFVLWWLGVAVAVVPFFTMLMKPEWRAPWFLGTGNFADNIIIAGRVFLIGATLGGWAWFLLQRTRPLPPMKEWWQQATSFNWLWFLVSFLIYGTHNVLLLFNLPFGPGELFFAAVGRILTAFIVLSLLWIFAHIASLAAPTRMRKIPWAIPAIFPGLLAADALGILFWKNSLRFIVNKIDEEGTFDLAGQLSAAGMTQSSLGILLGVALYVAVLSALCYGAFRLSQKVSPRVLRPRGVLLVLASVWVLLALEKGSGFAWKSRKALRMEQNSYDIHLTPLKPEPGVVSFTVAWKQPVRPKIDGTSELRPDIYVFMVESVRADAIAPENAPFLSSFRDNECQPLGRTWAASNATHLSWFSFFNGQFPTYWRDAAIRLRKGEDLAVSPLIDLLQKADYRIEARAVCDLTYNGMGATNFGTAPGFAVFKDAPSGTPFAKRTIPEREIANFAEAKEALINLPKGGNFQFIALDSPHFTYLWSPDFVPPIDYYDPQAAFHAFPTPDDILRVKNRYLNSVGFVDSQIEEFVQHLQKLERYDDAIIIVTGDHGEEFHEHGAWFHCSSLEEEQTSVPILIKWPEGTNLPKHASASHLDILPSLLHYFGEADASFADLPGRPLLKVNQEEATQITLTSLCGITGIAMAWTRDDYTATFRWETPWKIDDPSTIHLDDLVGPEGSLDLETSEEWQVALRKYFPDAPERLFETFEKR